MTDRNTFTKNELEAVVQLMADVEKVGKTLTAGGISRVDVKLGANAAGGVIEVDAHGDMVFRPTFHQSQGSSYFDR